MEVSIIPLNGKQLQAKFLKKATTFSKKEGPSAIMKALFLVEGDSKRNCPIDTGRLRASIRSQRLSDMSGKVFTDVEYAPYQEFGTAKLTGRFFMTNALNNNKTRIRYLLGIAVRTSVRA